MTPSRSAFHDFRGLRHHVRTWGDARAPQLVLLHGWMDVSASFQFLVDSFERDWHVIAPDLRGFGLTGWAPGGYWFPDYYADVEALLDIYAPGTPVHLAGHSMGGNIACTYAGIRPHRVRTVISMEGFGLGRTAATDAPARYARWLDELDSPPGFAPYDSFDAIARRLMKRNRRLTADKAAFLAEHWAKRLDSGAVMLRSDPRHKMVNPVLSRIDELIACWRNVTAPVLWIRSSETEARPWRTDTPGQFAERQSAFADFREVTLPDCAHMMHHDQPAALARVIEDFLSRNGDAG
jgi:pimeloyl-ACP methyl ester carboxylesterase